MRARVYISFLRRCKTQVILLWILHAQMHPYDHGNSIIVTLGICTRKSYFELEGSHALFHLYIYQGQRFGAIFITSSSINIVF
jgi:hypothetical protein